VTIQLNGTSHELAPGTTVADLLAQFDIATTGVAVALNGEVVPRAAHAETVVPDGAVIEVLTAAQGG
jgi:sulfur carrier protein